MSGKTTRRRDAIALALSAVLHVAFLSFVINESATPYVLPGAPPPPLEVEIVTNEAPPPPPPVIPPKIKRELKKQSQQPPPPPVTPPTPPKPEIRPPSPVAPPKRAQPKPTPPTPTPPTPVTPTPTPVKPTPPKPNSVPAAPAPSRAPTPATPSPSPSPAPSPSPNPAPRAAVVSPNPTTARITAPVVMVRPSMLNLHKPTKEAPPGVPTLPLAPSGAAGGGGGGGGGGAPGALTGSRLNGLSPYPYGALPSGGPGLRGTLVGCANADAVNLSSVERARCNERFGVEAAQAPVLDGIDPAKRARFDKIAGRQENERKAGMPVGTTAGAQGFGGLGPN